MGMQYKCALEQQALAYAGRAAAAVVALNRSLDEIARGNYAGEDELKRQLAAAHEEVVSWTNISATLHAADDAALMDSSVSVLSKLNAAAVVDEAVSAGASIDTVT